MKVKPCSFSSREVPLKGGKGGAGGGFEWEGSDVDLETILWSEYSTEVELDVEPERTKWRWFDSDEGIIWKLFTEALSLSFSLSSSSSSYPEMKNEKKSKERKI